MRVSVLSDTQVKQQTGSSFCLLFSQRISLDRNIYWRCCGWSGPRTDCSVNLPRKSMLPSPSVTPRPHRVLHNLTHCSCDCPLVNATTRYFAIGCCGFSAQNTLSTYKKHHAHFELPLSVPSRHHSSCVCWAFFLMRCFARCCAALYTSTCCPPPPERTGSRNMDG